MIVSRSWCSWNQLVFFPREKSGFVLLVPSCGVFYGKVSHFSLWKLRLRLFSVRSFFPEVRDSTVYLHFELICF